MGKSIGKAGAQAPTRERTESNDSQKSTSSGREWAKKNKVETGLIVANIAILLGVVAMGIAGSCFGKGISFQDMVSSNGWKITAISAGALLGADLLIAGASYKYKQKRPSETNLAHHIRTKNKASKAD